MDYLDYRLDCEEQRRDRAEEDLEADRPDEQQDTAKDTTKFEEF